MATSKGMMDLLGLTGAEIIAAILLTDKGAGNQPDTVVLAAGDDLLDLLWRVVILDNKELADLVPKTIEEFEKSMGEYDRDEDMSKMEEALDLYSNRITEEITPLVRQGVRVKLEQSPRYMWPEGVSGREVTITQDPDATHMYTMADGQPLM